LPPHFVPVLGDALDRAKSALARILPEVKTTSALEEAEFEEPTGAGFEQEKLMQGPSPWFSPISADLRPQISSACASSSLASSSAARPGWGRA